MEGFENNTHEVDSLCLLGIMLTTVFRVESLTDKFYGPAGTNQFHPTGHNGKSYFFAHICFTATDGNIFSLVIEAGFRAKSTPLFIDPQTLVVVDKKRRGIATSTLLLASCGDEKKHKAELFHKNLQCALVQSLAFSCCI